MDVAQLISDGSNHGQAVNLAADQDGEKWGEQKASQNEE